MVVKLELLLENHKHTLEFVALLVAIVLLLFTAFQSFNAKKQIELSRETLDLQFKPRLDIEFNSPRISTLITQNEYKKADYIQFYRNDFIKQQDFGKTTFSETSQVSAPFNITIFNWGEATAKLQRIRYDFSCDSKDKKDWQVDILRKRTILPSEEIYYANRLFLDFETIPIEMKWCEVKFDFIFNEGIVENVTYRVLYSNYTSDIVDLQRKNQEW